MKKLLLVGAGPMAVEYAKVLAAKKLEFDVVGRGAASAEAFAKATGKSASVGGLEAWLSSNAAADYEAAIDAVGEKGLGLAAKALIRAGFGKILVEKPGAFNLEELEELGAAADKAKAKAEVAIGYNRRFYASVLAAKDIIAADGGATSFHFEFTEWAHKLDAIAHTKEAGVMEHWFLHNSSHVVDLAFFLGGEPATLSAFHGGSIPWHPSGSVFTGAGLTKAGAGFSYCANWRAPGRWGVEIMTARTRLILKPLESLQAIKLGSVAVEAIEIDDRLDREFKPGLFKQVEAFLSGDRALCRLAEQLRFAEHYRHICEE